jgi:hypothetical protein
MQLSGQARARTSLLLITNAGANENDMVVDARGRLLVIFRVDGGDGFPHHSHKPYMQVRSTDGGFTWSKPVSLPPTMLSARPQMLMVGPDGPLIMTGGRPRLMLWVAWDGTGDSGWAEYNIASQHNKGLPPQSNLSFCTAFANGSATWLESTCYTSIQKVGPTVGHPDSPAMLLCYDRMGTEPPAAPPECQPERVYTFCMQIAVHGPNSTEAGQVSAHGTVSEHLEPE